jgi:hypothetical protein
VAKIPGKCVQWTDGAKIYGGAPHTLNDDEIEYQNSILQKNKASNEPLFVCIDEYFIDPGWTKF